MEKALIAIGVILLTTSVLNIYNEQQNVEIGMKFQQFKQKYNKEYSKSEEQYRLSVYQGNWDFVNRFNEKKGRVVFGETQFFDLTDEEFKEIYLTLRVEEEVNEPKVKFHKVSEEFIDWRAKGAVTDIKNQGKCGSCWTFSTTGMLEGYFFVNTKLLPSLSEQQLVDCSTSYDLNFGCNGGMPARALNYVKRNGLTTELDYPYKGVQGECLKKGGAYRANGHIFIEATEEGLLGALAIQPVSVGVDASNWKYYDPKAQLVFEDCGEVLNHAVLAVAYDADSYIIKNSWATTFGNLGYIHLKRGASTCGVWNNMVIPA